MTSAILSVPGATLRVMDTLSNISDTSYQLPLSEADQTALRPALLHDLGAMPFESGALISRSLWVIFIGEWGVWTHATLPVDDRLDMPDRKSITGLCDLVGSLMSPPLCHDDEKAMIVLRRPGPAEISEADAYIFRQVRQAAARRETAPLGIPRGGTGRNTGGDGARGPAGPCADTRRHTRVSRRVPGGRRQSWEGPVRRGRTPRISEGPSRRNPPR